MPLRGRLVLLAGAAVAAAILAAAIVSYAAVRSELRGQIDGSLRDQGDAVERFSARPGRLPRRLPAPPRQSGQASGYAQRLTPAGRSLAIPGGQPRLPVGPAERTIARHGRGRRFSELRSRGEHVRVLTVGIGKRGAIQLGRSLQGVDSVLGRLRLILGLLVVAGAGVAALLARLFTRAVLAPLSELEQAAEHITETEDLARRIAAAGNDEVGRLATRFNEMLDTLEASRSALAKSVVAQRQLLADASHELRTPITGLRTNLEVLMNGAQLDPSLRKQLLADLVTETEELSDLITDVIELARGDEPAAFATEEVRLDLHVQEAVERAQRFAPETAFRATLEPTLVRAAPDRLQRAVNNLLDNAVKHGPPGGPVEVRVADGELTVRDWGIGVRPEDAAHVFDRFYRGAGSHEVGGSGLGLAIVRQVATTHGGEVAVEQPADGGALFRFSLPSDQSARTPEQ